VADKLWFLIPEVMLFAGAVIATILGLSPRRAVRDSVPVVTCLILAATFVVTPLLYADDARVEAAGLLMPVLGRYVKMIVCLLGIGLAMLSAGMIDRRLEAAIESGRLPFDALRVNRGEYFAFFLLSLIGVMLCAGANDLIWLFLALELTSLPTYIMVAISRGSKKAQEAAVKYFFLGALAAAMFLYGFALLYGSTGTMVLTEMREAFVEQARSGGINRLGILGMILTLLGVSFKIAAAPMHFYAADVYEGAASPVTAFLAFVPKTAGMIAIIMLLATVGWTGHMATTTDGLRVAIEGLPPQIVTTLWMISVLTMTLGNIGALLQKSVKRVLAYSSIAHSGYMLIGVIAGPGWGVNAVLFYLLAYGLMNTAAFGVLAGLERRGRELESLDDLAGLRLRHPAMAATMAVAAASLLGVPPLLGFIGKFYLFVAGVQAGQIMLVVIAGLNSAISAWYYLGLVKLPILEKPSPQAETIVRSPVVWPRLAAVTMSAALVVVPIFSGPLADTTDRATRGYDAPLRISDDRSDVPSDDAIAGDGSPRDEAARGGE
jgi:NADH-quinone oxidoreductase subunit N